MEFKTYRFGKITVNFDKKRIPLSGAQREKRRGTYRYYGAQGVIDYIDDYIFDGTYLLIAEDGENLKSKKQNIAQIATGQFWVNNHAHIVQGNELCDTRFLCYLINSMDLSGYITGSAQPKLSQANLNAVDITIPEITAQRKIVDYLYTLDQKIDTNNRINDNLQQQLRAIFMERFTNNPVLESIQQVPLSELCSVVTKGTTPTTLGKPFVDRGINFLKAESILDNHSLDKGKFAHIDEETHDMLKRSVIYAGDIVFTIAGTLGRFALIDSDILPANTNQAVAIIRADKGKISPEYLYACFIGNWHNDYYSKRVQQAVQANLSLTTIKSLPIPVLTQDEMVSYMALISPIIKMLKQNEMENERLAALRDTLLPRLMSGEVDVSNIDI